MGCPRSCPWGSQHRWSCLWFLCCLWWLLWTCFFLWQGWTGGGSSFEGRSSLGCLITGCFVVATKAERLLRSVPLLQITRARFSGFQEYSCLIPCPHTVTRMECWKFKAELLVHLHLWGFVFAGEAYIHSAKGRSVGAVDLYTKLEGHWRYHHFFLSMDFALRSASSNSPIPRFVIKHCNQAIFGCEPKRGIYIVLWPIVRYYLV